MGYADWENPSHWKPGGRSCTQAPCVVHRSASRSPTIVASVTTMDGMRAKATSAPLSAPSAPPASTTTSITAGTGRPAFDDSPATTEQIAKTDPTEMSISPQTMTSVAPRAMISTGTLARNRSVRLAREK